MPLRPDSFVWLVKFGKQHRKHLRQHGYNETEKQRILNDYQERSFNTQP